MMTQLVSALLPSRVATDARSPPAYKPSTSDWLAGAPTRSKQGAHLAATLLLGGDGIVGGRPTLKNSPGKALPAPAAMHGKPYTCLYRQ
jgi:hypothetical protein